MNPRRKQGINQLIEKYKEEWSKADVAAKSAKLNGKHSTSRIEQGKRFAYTQMINDLVLINQP